MTNPNPQKRSVTEGMKMTRHFKHSSNISDIGIYHSGCVYLNIFCAIWFAIWVTEHKVVAFKLRLVYSDTTYNMSPHRNSFNFLLPWAQLAIRNV